MWIEKKEFPASENEPIGTITEHILHEGDGEGRDAFIELFVEEQEVGEVCCVSDEITDEYIELDIWKYFSDVEIDLLNEMFIEDDEWTAPQIKFILEKLK